MSAAAAGWETGAFFRLDGKVTLVTGAGQGLGRAIAERLAAAGARVAVNDLDAARASDVAHGIIAAGGDAVALPGDAAAEASIEAMFASLDRTLGSIDVLVNNAGITVAEDIFDMAVESWNRVIATNLTGPTLMSRCALSRMRDAGNGGRIIMVGSMVGHQGAVKGWVHYGASKSGLHGLAKTLSRTAARHRVTVNVVAPGIIETDMLASAHDPSALARLLESVPIGSLGRPIDVAAAVHFLASAEASYVTGAILDVNGGMYVRP